MTSTGRFRAILLAGFAVWAAAECTALAMPALQEPDSTFCGRVLSVTCASRTSDARMLLEASDGYVLDVWIPAPMREDLIARLGERHPQRKVCVARDAAPWLTGGRIRMRHLGQLTVGDDPAPAAREDVASTCDPSVQPPEPLHHPAVRYTPEAMRAGVSGTVTLSGIVEADGHVSDIHVVRSLDEGLDAEATKAFTQWRFRPVLRMGQAVAVAVTAEIAFQISAPR